MTDAQYATELSRIQSRSAQRRSEEWANIPDRVLGLPLRPITLATFALLHGTRNAFVCGLSPTLRDVRDYILFHSPDFDPDRPVPKFYRRLRIALRTAHALCPLWRRRGQDEVTAINFGLAVKQIRGIIERTWADALPPTDESHGPTVAAAIEPTFADSFASEYEWWPLATPMRHTPIARLFQLQRSADRRKYGSAAVYFDRDEAALTRDYLAAANAETANRNTKENATPCA